MGKTEDKFYRQEDIKNILHWDCKPIVLTAGVQHSYKMTIYVSANNPLLK